MEASAVAQKGTRRV